MYTKIIITGTLLFIWSLFISISVYSEWESPLDIISRAEWWADEQYTYIDSTYWQDIIASRSKAQVSNTSPDIAKKRRDDHDKKIAFINENFSQQYTIAHRQRYEGDKKLAWQIQKSDYVNAIVIHHTATEYESSQKGIQDIHRFHSLSRQWGDIGYNYIIWYDGEIYEWRKWGDYSVWAHVVWNNISTVWVAVMWDYHGKPINKKQYKSLEKLVQHLSFTYGIDLDKNYYYNYNCSGAACNIFPLETHLRKTLSWHRDAGHTNCPGDELYKQIEQIRLDNTEYSKWFTPVKRWDNNHNLIKSEKVWDNGKIIKLLKTFSKVKLEQLISVIETRLEVETNREIIRKLKIIRILAKNILSS